MMDELPDPLRDFVEQLKKTSDAMVRETKELDDALMRGRVGDLVKKYHAEAKQQLSDDDDTDDDDSTTGDVESKAS